MSQELENQVESLRGKLRMLQNLEKDPAFILVLQNLQAEINQMQNAIVLRPLSNMDEVLKQEYDKGRIEGRLSIAHHIEQEKETLEYEIKQRQDQLENEENPTQPSVP